MTKLHGIIIDGEIYDFPVYSGNSQTTPIIVPSSSTESTTEIIDVATSDKIGIISTSYMNGYTMKNHHHLNHISMFMDYIFYNYGVSGDDEIENLARLEKDDTWMGVIPPSKWNMKYAFIMHHANSSALRAADDDAVYYNSKILANTLKSMGAIPIFSTEFSDDYSYYQGVLRLCKEEGYMYMDWGYGDKTMICGYFAPMWYFSHPSTRTGWLFASNLLPYFQSLPRPDKAVKLFRLRDGIDDSNLDANLMYDDNYSRAKRFIELTCGVVVLKTENEKYFDRLDVAAMQPLSAITTIYDEYQKIQNKNTVSFGNYALAEFITPYDSNHISGMTVSVTGNGISNAYIKKIRNLTHPLSEKRYQAFGIVSGAENISSGDTITISGISRADGTGLNKTYTVQGVINSMIVTTTYSSNSSPNKSSGTDSPVCNINGVTLSGSYDYPSMDYMTRYNKPIGEWVEVNYNNGNIILDSYLKNCMDFDKIAILFKGSNISISDIRANVKGGLKKTVRNIPFVEYKNGTSVITDNLFDNGTAWSNLSALTTYNNTLIKSTVDNTKYEGLPDYINTVKVLNEGEMTQQRFISSAITQPNNVRHSVKLQIRVIARYFPEYIDSDEKWPTSPINPQSFDVAKLAIAISFGDNGTQQMKVASLNVGCWWHEYIVETICSPHQAGYIKLQCDDKSVQIARCEVVKIN